MDFLNPYNVVEIPLLELIRNLGIGVGFGVILAWLVGNSSRLVVDTRQYLPLFMLLIPTMILVITIIKSSIALSLGLVGALSIVRFRTPIKEPEELAYIFMAITIGLGLGANQVLATVIGFGVVVLVMLPSIYSRETSERGQSSFIDIVLEPDGDTSLDLRVITALLDESALKYRLKRVSETRGRHEITLQVPSVNAEAYERVKNELMGRYRDVEISLIDNARVIT